ncbi:MAG: DinB family protein, partial [Planctomycetota bacterium]
MNSRDAIKAGLDMGNLVGMAYLEDMTDDELMQRPVPGCNHIKWQIGHLIASENQINEGVAPGSMPALPEGFAERYTKETSTSDDPAAFDSKETLLGLYQEQRA